MVMRRARRTLGHVQDARVHAEVIGAPEGATLKAKDEREVIAVKLRPLIQITGIDRVFAIQKAKRREAAVGVVIRVNLGGAEPRQYRHMLE